MADDTLAKRLAALGSKAPTNPVVMYLMGNPAKTAPGKPAAPQPAQPNPVVRAATSAGKAIEDQAKAIQAKLLSRIRTVEETGWGQPGPGTLPGAALRPEVRSMFEPAGGVSVIDLNGITPEEQNYLRFLLDPSWVAKQNDPGSGMTEEEKASARAKTMPTI